MTPSIQLFNAPRIGTNRPDPEGRQLSVPCTTGNTNYAIWKALMIFHAAVRPVLVIPLARRFQFFLPVPNFHQARAYCRLPSKGHIRAHVEFNPSKDDHTEVPRLYRSFFLVDGVFLAVGRVGCKRSFLVANSIFIHIGSEDALVFHRQS